MTESKRWLVEADRYRADVHQHQPSSDGYCGFSLPADRLASAQFVKVMCLTPKLALPSLDRVESRSSGKLFRIGDCHAFLDTDLLESGISGWVRNVTTPDWRAAVTLNRDGSAIHSRSATLYREDLRQADNDGFHGFSFPPMAHARGTWSLTEAATGIVLPIRPRASP